VTSECIKKPAMSASIDQCALIMLAVDLDQGATELFEDLHAHWLIIDESPCPPVGELDATEDQFVLSGNIIGHKKRACGMIARDVEHSRHLTLFHALPHQRLVAASAQGQSEGVEKDRLTSTGLASENGEAVGKVDVEPID
jgi:hypothetical protein